MTGPQVAVFDRFHCTMIVEQSENGALLTLFERFEIVFLRFMRVQQPPVVSYYRGLLWQMFLQLQLEETHTNSLTCERVILRHTDTARASQV